MTGIGPLSPDDGPLWQPSDAIDRAQDVLEDALELCRRVGTGCHYAFALFSLEDMLWIATLSEAMPLTDSLIADLALRPVELRGVLSCYLSPIDDLRVGDGQMSEVFVGTTVRSPHPTEPSQTTRIMIRVTAEDVAAHPWPFLLAYRPRRWPPF